MKEVNDFVGWGVDAYGNKVLFCSRFRAVFYRTSDDSKIIQAKRVFGRKHQCPKQRRCRRSERWDAISVMEVLYSSAAAQG